MEQPGTGSMEQPALAREDSDKLTQEELSPRKLSVTLCCVLGFSWVLVLFYVDVATVAVMCGDRDKFKLWVTVFGFGGLAILIIVQLFLVVSSCMRCSCVANLGPRFHLVSGAFSLVMPIWGWAAYAFITPACK